MRFPPMARRRGGESAGRRERRTAFTGAFMLLAPASVARLLPWGYYAVIIPARFVTSGDKTGYEYISPPSAWITGFLILTTLAFAFATHRLDRIER